MRVPRENERVDADVAVLPQPPGDLLGITDEGGAGARPGPPDARPQQWLGVTVDTCCLAELPRLDDGRGSGWCVEVAP